MKMWKIVAILIVVLILGLTVGIAGGYYVGKNNLVDTKSSNKETKEAVKAVVDNPNAEIAAATSVTNARLTISKDENSPMPPAVEKWTGEITLAPKNKQLLSQKITKPSIADYQTGNCGAGAIQYFTKFNEIKNPELPLLTITNRNIDMGEIQKNSFEKMYKFVENQSTNKTELSNFIADQNLVFTGLCQHEGFSGLSGSILDEIKPISVTGLDHAITYSSYIYGIKGDYLLRYQNLIRVDSIISKKINDDCQAERNYNPSVGKDLLDCIERKNLLLPEYQKLRENAIQELLTNFSL